MSQSSLRGECAAFESLLPLFSPDLDFLLAEPLGEAVSKAGFASREAYASLIQCVYVHMSNQLDAPHRLYTLRADKPLYIQYDGSAAHFLRLIRCVYSALPLSMRRTLLLSVGYALVPEARKWNFLFTTDAKAKDGFYVIPASGENNVLTRRAVGIIGGGYVSYAPRQLPADAFAPFFEGLDACARDLGHADASNDKVLNIAWKYFWNHDAMSWDTASWDRNTRRFSLRAGLSHNALKRLLSNIFSCEIYSGGMASLACQIVETVGADELTENLREKWNKYPASPDNALKHLLDIPLSETPENVLEAELREFSGTPEILRKYCETLLTSEAISWDLLKAVRTVLTLISEQDRAGLDNLLNLKAAELCTEDIQLGKKPMFALREYTLLAGLVMTGSFLREALDSMRELYWEIFQWNTFDFRKAEEYRYFGIVGRKNKVLALLDLSERYIPGDESGFLLYVHQYFQDFEWEIDSTERVMILTPLCERLRKQYAPHLYEDWVKWASYVNVGDDYIDVIRQLYEALYPFDADKLLKAYIHFHHKRVLWNPGRGERARIVGRVQSSCIQNDTKGRPVPLDLWLMIGLDSGGNPFEIFDRLFNFGEVLKWEPFVFRQNAEDVVRSSTELSSLYKYGDTYVNSPGNRKPRAIVRKWLKEWMKLPIPPQGKDNKS